jgi:copper resistance protein C
MSGVLALAGTPAVAHDALLDSEPADGAVVTQAPDRVLLSFAATQAEIGAEVVVTGPDGTVWSDGPAVVSGATVTQPLKAGMPSGEYTVLWRSVAGDGHPVDGALGFTLDLPVDPPPPVDVIVETPAISETPATAPPEAAAEPVDGRSAVPWLVAGASVLALGAVGVGLARRAGR